MLLFCLAVSAFVLAVSAGGLGPALGTVSAILLYAVLLTDSLFIRGLSALLWAAVAGVLLLAWSSADTPSWIAVLAAAFLLGAAIGVQLRHFYRAPEKTLRLLTVLAGAALILCLFCLLLMPLSQALGLPFVLSVNLVMVLVAVLEWRRRSWIGRPHRRLFSISVLLICKDEADRIEECLQRVSGWADEIVVLDSGSTDGTQDIVRRYTGKLHETDWAGYSRQKQRALEKCSCDWVLNIDADEYLTTELKQEIDAWLAQPVRANAFKMPWVSWVFGGLIYFGADGRYHKRLFRREGARFNDADVHEDVLVSGPVEMLGGPVVHDTFRDYSHLKSKLVKYAMIRGEEMRRANRTSTPLHALLKAIGTFLILFIRRMAVLDGRRGILMAAAYAIYAFDKYAYVWVRNRDESG